MTMLTRRRILGTTLAGLGAAIGPVPASRAAPDLSRVTLRIGVFRGFDETILPGTGHADFPYKVEYAEFNAGNLITQAINADAIDLGSWSEIPLVFAAASHANVRVVATMSGPTENQAVLVPKSSTARSIADLKGKRVGYIRATTAHYFLIKMLAQHGLTFDDIQPIALGMSAGLGAMQSGALDAWATYGYAIATLEANIGARVLQNADGILSGNYFYGANPKRLSDPAFRAAAADYAGRMNLAFGTLERDKQRWAKLVAPAVQVPESVALAYLRAEQRPWSLRAVRKSDIASANDVAATFAKAGLLPTGVDVTPYVSDALAPLLARS